MTDAIREAERLIALDEERIEYVRKVERIAAGGAGAWFKLRDELPEMMACIRGLYNHIAERYGVEVKTKEE